MKTISILDRFTALIGSINFIQMYTETLAVTVDGTVVTVSLSDIHAEDPERAGKIVQEFIDELCDAKRMSFFFGRNQQAIAVDFSSVSAVGLTPASTPGQDVIFIVAGGRLHHFKPNGNPEYAFDGLKGSWTESRSAAATR